MLILLHIIVGSMRSKTQVDMARCYAFAVFDFSEFADNFFNFDRFFPPDGTFVMFPRVPDSVLLGRTICFNELENRFKIPRFFSSSGFMESRTDAISELALLTPCDLSL